MTNPPTARSKPAPHPSYNQGCTLTATTDVPLSDLAVQLGITVSHQTNRLGSRIRKAPTSPGRCSGRQNCRTIDPNAPPVDRQALRRSASDSRPRPGALSLRVSFPGTAAAA